jgi:hypothetical protein
MSGAARFARVAMAAGLVVALASGLLPGRLLMVCAASGSALALLGAAVLLSSASHAGLRWKGASPALAIVLGVIVGALPGLLSGAWRRGDDHPVARPRPVARMIASARWQAQPPVLAPAVPEVTAAPAAAPPRRPAGAAVSELSYILDHQARPALDSLSRLLTSLAGAPDSTDPATLRSQLEPNMDELAQAAAALEKVQAETPDLSPELREAIGEGRALSSLNASLHQLSVSQGDARSYGATRLQRLASAADAAGKWVDRVDQQLAASQ